MRATYGRQLPRSFSSAASVSSKSGPAAATKRPPLLHRLRPAVSAAAHRVPLAVQRVLSLRRQTEAAALDGDAAASLPADAADLLAQLAACPARHLNDALTQPAGQPGEAPFVVALVEHARAGDYLGALLDGVLLRRLPELGTPARAALVLALRHVGARAAPPGFSGLPAAFARALVTVLVGTRGGQLGALKDAINVCGPECDLFSLVYRDVGSLLLRYQLLQHFAAEAARALSAGGGGGAPSRPVQLVTDMDDTLACMWVDSRFYPRGTVYPGVAAFVAELHGSRWPLATAGTKAAAAAAGSVNGDAPTLRRLPPGWWCAMLAGPRAAPPAAALRIDDVDDAVGGDIAHAPAGGPAVVGNTPHHMHHHHQHGHHLHHHHQYLQQQHLGYFVASDGDGLPRPPDDADGDVAVALSPQRPPARLRAAAQRFRDAYRRRWRGLLAGSEAQLSFTPPPPPPPATVASAGDGGAAAAPSSTTSSAGEPLSPTRRRYHAARAWLRRQAAAAAVPREGRHLLRRGLSSFYSAAGGGGKAGPAPRLPAPNPLTATSSSNGSEAAPRSVATAAAADASCRDLPAPTSLVVLTARPADYRGLVKQATLAKLAATGLGVGLELDRLPGDVDDALAATAAAAKARATAGAAHPPPHAIVLLGSLLRSTSTAAIVAKKGENLDAYRCLWPEAAFVLLGDSGQGDTAVAAAALSGGANDGSSSTDNTLPPPLAPVVGAFIHDVTPGSAVTGDGGGKEAYARRYGPSGLGFFATYAGAAGLAAARGLLSPDAAVRVARAAVADLTRVRWDGAPKLPTSPPSPNGAPSAPTSVPDRAKAAAIAALVADLRADIIPLMCAPAAGAIATAAESSSLEALLPPGLLDDDPLWRAAVRG